MNMALEAAQAHEDTSQMILTPLSPDELGVCLGSLLASLERHPEASLDATFILTLRLALTAVQGAVPLPAESDPYLPKLQTRITELERQARSSQTHWTEQVRGATHRAETAETVVRGAERAMQTVDGTARGLVNRVIALVSQHSTLQLEAARLRQAVASINPTEITELGAKAAKVDELELQVRRLQEAAVTVQERSTVQQAKKLGEQKAQLKAEIAGMVARERATMRQAVESQLTDYEWSASNRQHKGLACCPACSGLRPDKRYQSSDLFGHQRGCAFVAIRNHAREALVS